MPDNNYFDKEYAGSDSTKVEKSEISEIKKFLREPLPSAEIKQYGISKPTRILIRGRVAKE